MKWIFAKFENVTILYKNMHLHGNPGSTDDRTQVSDILWGAQMVTKERDREQTRKGQVKILKMYVF